jgi:hypothetical protein
MVGDLREYLGKHAKHNQELLLTRTAMLLEERKRDRKETRIFTSQDTRTKSDHTKLAISPILCHQLILIEKIGLWKGEDDIYVGSKDTWKAQTILTDPSGENELNVQILFEISQAEKQIMDYFDTYYLSGELNQVARSEKDVSFRKTPVLLESVTQARNDEVTRQTSTEPKTLEALCTKEYMQSELLSLCNQFETVEREIADAIPRNAKKYEYCKLLAKAHQILIDDDEDEDGSYVQFVKDEIDNGSLPCRGFADPSKKAEELKHPFYTFPKEVYDSYKSKMRIEYEMDDKEDEFELEPGDETHTQEVDDENIIDAGVNGSVMNELLIESSLDRTVVGKSIEEEGSYAMDFSAVFSPGFEFSTPALLRLGNGRASICTPMSADFSPKALDF